MFGAVTVGPQDLARELLGAICLFVDACLVRAGMKRHLVEGLIVYTLDNVDFAPHRPVRANGPETWPRRTTYRHEGGVEDKETAIVAFLRHDTDAATVMRLIDTMNTVFTHEARLPPAATVLVESTARTNELSQGLT